MTVSSIALSALQASTQGLAVGANNTANLNTEGFRAQRLDLAEQAQGGVRASALRTSEAPRSPGASNVDLAQETTSRMGQAGTYNANLKVLEIDAEMTATALDLKA